MSLFEMARRNGFRKKNISACLNHSSSHVNHTNDSCNFYNDRDLEIETIPFETNVNNKLI